MPASIRLRISAFLSELKRRRVFRVLVAYAVAAWLLIQIAATVAPELGLPGWTTRLVLVLVIAGLPLAIGLAWAFDVTPAGIERTEDKPAASASSEAPAAAAVATDEDRRSIAVLPFVNMSAEADNEYFSDGVTEELLNVLAQIPELRVAARTSAFSFKGKDVPVQEVGRALRVGHVLEGSVRKSGDRVRITAQLVGAADGYHLWSQTYDRELCDVFAVQDEIARVIADVLRVRLGVGDARPRARETNPETHALYLRGRYSANLGTRDGLERAIRLYEQALQHDPEYAPAYGAIAEAYGWLADGFLNPLAVMPQIEASARKAIALDETLADGHAALGMMQSQWGWVWDEAERELKRALELNPSHAMAHLYYSAQCLARGDIQKAIAECREAHRLDPLSPVHSYFLELFHAYAGDPDGALAQHAVTEQIAPGFAYLGSLAGEAYRAKGMIPEAIAAFRADEAALDRPSPWLAALFAATGEREEAQRMLADLEARAAAGEYLAPESVARVHAALGDEERAFEWLERGVDTRSALAPHADIFVELRPLMASERYRPLRARMGLS